MEYKFVSFDVTDATFSFFTQVEWDNLIAAARKELMAESESQWAFAEHTEWETADVYELLQAMYGEEFFWEEIA